MERDGDEAVKNDDEGQKSDGEDERGKEREREIEGDENSRLTFPFEWK